ncbi:hypothetical protein M7775_19145 [Sporomusa sphaeroides DSM 2875]|uniref:hypothetical protein n=1 Tax=Sporomusa sphaeroides TaxID=47679 RepID=UPI00202FF534|nr:hypothetical protein [Sporomusa sphaeroides]MCM0760670.1 hypothetical protein [Sporomusa sphaeroides DSM 2875]
MALSPNALTTVAAFKAYMELDMEDISQDSTIEMTINAVSDWIEGETDRKYALAEYEKTFTGNGRQLILLDYYPVNSATVFRIMPDGNSEFTNWTLKKDMGALEAKEGWNGFEYTVSYAAGYVLPKDETEENARTLPAELENTCIEIVAIRMEKKNSNHLAVEVTGPLRDEFLPCLPYHLQKVIDRYKKKVIA